MAEGSEAEWSQSDSMREESESEQELSQHLKCGSEDRQISAPSQSSSVEESLSEENAVGGSLEGGPI